MIIDKAKINALTQELAPRWVRTFTFDQIHDIILDKKNQHAVERGMNVYGMTELEAWNKVLSFMFHRSI